MTDALRGLFFGFITSVDLGVAPKTMVASSLVKCVTCTAHIPVFYDNKSHYTFIIFQLWLTSHPRSTVALLDTGTPGTSREIYSEDADYGTRTRNPSVIN